MGPEGVVRREEVDRSEGGGRSESVGRRASFTVNTWSSSLVPLSKSSRAVNLTSPDTWTINAVVPRSAREGSDTDYSVSEYSASFTIITPRTGRRMVVVNDDTDVEEEDEGFKEYSAVTFEQKPALTNTMGRKRVRRTLKKKKDPSESCATSYQTPSSSMCGKPPSGQSVRCTTSCASTYHNFRERRKTMAGLSSSATPSPVPSPSPRPYRPPTPTVSQPVEGCWKLVGSINFEEYLAALGTGPCTQDLVMRAGMVLRIQQEEDKQWRLSSETLIQAKSARGYRTRNRKWTENKLKVGEAKPELLEDWDQRLVVTTLEVEEGGSKLSLRQVAEKELWCRVDSLVYLEVDEEEEDTLIMTCMTGEVVGWRKFIRMKEDKRNNSRKISAPF